MSPSPVVGFRLGDIVRLSRRHPCGGAEWLIDRIGADIGLRCLSCGRHVLLERRALERRLVTFVHRGDEELTNAAAPHPNELGRPSAGGPEPNDAGRTGAIGARPNDETAGR